MYIKQCTPPQRLLVVLVPLTLVPLGGAGTAGIGASWWCWCLLVVLVSLVLVPLGVAGTAGVGAS